MEPGTQPRDSDDSHLRHVHPTTPWRTGYQKQLTSQTQETSVAPDSLLTLLGAGLEPRRSPVCHPAGAGHHDLQKCPASAVVSFAELNGLPALAHVGPPSALPPSHPLSADPTKGQASCLTPPPAPSEVPDLSQCVKHWTQCKVPRIPSLQDRATSHLAKGWIQHLPDDTD